MDLSKIEKIAELMKAHGLAEVEVEEGESRIRLAFSTATAGMMPMAQPMMMPPMAAPLAYGAPAAVAAPAAAPGAAEAPARAPERAAAGHGANQKTVKSPFVGTFYEAPSPGSEPFVRVGKRIKKGDTLCIIEAMKLMNGIESEVDGVVVEILAKNGEPVEFDQPLFIVEP